MAKAKAEKNVSENGSLVFERLGKDFEIPVIVKGTQFDEPLKQLADNPGEVVCLYAVDPADARKAYVKCKALKTAAEHHGITVEAVVRKMPFKGEVKTCVLASVPK